MCDYVDFKFSKDILIMFKVFSIFGLFCGLHKISITNNQITLIGTKYKIYSVIFGIFMLSGLMKIVYETCGPLAEYPKALKFTVCVTHNILSIAYVSFTFSSIFIIPKSVRKICHNLTEVDRTLEVNDKNYARRMYFKLIAFIMCYTGYKIIQAIGDFSLWMIDKYYIFVHMVLIFYDLENFFCIFGLNAVARRFEKLNHSVKKSKYLNRIDISIHNSIWIKIWKIDYDKIKDVSSKKCTLEEYLFVYEKLLGVVEIIKNCYKLMVTIILYYIMYKYMRCT